MYTFSHVNYSEHLYASNVFNVRDYVARVQYLGCVCTAA